MDQTTKIYENTTDKDINVVGVGVIAAHDRVSITGQFHAPVNLANYPGVVDVLAEEAKGVPATAPISAPQMPPAPGMQGGLETNKAEGN